jgi:hypothetical protein
MMPATLPASTAIETAMMAATVKASVMMSSARVPVMMMMRVRRMRALVIRQIRAARIIKSSEPKAAWLSVPPPGLRLGQDDSEYPHRQSDGCDQKNGYRFHNLECHNRVLFIYPSATSHLREHVPHRLAQFAQFKGFAHNSIHALGQLR